MRTRTPGGFFRPEDSEPDLTRRNSNKKWSSPVRLSASCWTSMREATVCARVPSGAPTTWPVFTPLLHEAEPGRRVHGLLYGSGGRQAEENRDLPLPGRLQVGEPPKAQSPWTPISAWSCLSLPTPENFRTSGWVLGA